MLEDFRLKPLREKHLKGAPAKKESKEKVEKLPTKHKK